MKFTVVVPVFEHWHLIPHLIACLEKQVLSLNDFEVILVDNGSIDFSPPRILPGNVRIISTDTPGSYAARNYGAEKALGEWLVFTDADCLPRAEWLLNLYHASEQMPDKNGLLAGQVSVVSNASKPNIYEIYDVVKGIPQEQYVRKGYAATANLAVPQKLFSVLGGFDSLRYSSGDADFCHRADAAGYSIRLVPQAIVDHPARKTWLELATKARRIKGGRLGVGSFRDKIPWLIRTFKSPIVTPIRFFLDGKHPLHYRLIASAIYFRIWMVELAETVRLLTGKRPERR